MIIVNDWLRGLSSYSQCAWNPLKYLWIYAHFGWFNFFYTSNDDDPTHLYFDILCLCDFCFICIPTPFGTFCFCFFSFWVYFAPMAILMEIYWLKVDYFGDIIRLNMAKVILKIVDFRSRLTLEQNWLNGNL